MTSAFVWLAIRLDLRLHRCRLAPGGDMLGQLRGNR